MLPRPGEAPALADEHYWFRCVVAEDFGFFRCVVAGEDFGFFPEGRDAEWQVGPDESAEDV